MLKYYAHIGDGDIPEQVKSLIPVQDWTSGMLYSKIGNQDIHAQLGCLFGPRDENQLFFPQGINLNLNDCILHAINFCLRNPWFVQKEQAFRLIKKNYHKTESQIAATKIQLGFKV